MKSQNNNTANNADMSKALKLYALALRGVGGEKRNAQTLLNNHIEKKGYTMQDVINTYEDLDVQHSPEDMVKCCYAIPQFKGQYIDLIAIYAATGFQIGLQYLVSMGYNVECDKGATAVAMKGHGMPSVLYFECKQKDRFVIMSELDKIVKKGQQYMLQMQSYFIEDHITDFHPSGKVNREYQSELKQLAYN